MVEAIPHVAPEGFEDQLGKKVPVLFPNLADLPRGLQELTVDPIANTRENHWSRSGLLEADVQNHGKTLEDMPPGNTGKAGKPFPRCSHAFHRTPATAPYLPAGCLLALTPIGACGHGVSPGAHLVGCFARTASTCMVSHLGGLAFSFWP